MAQAMSGLVSVPKCVGEFSRLGAPTTCSRLSVHKHTTCGSYTGNLIEEALAVEVICSRLAPDLPMAVLPIVEAKNMEGLTLGLSLMRQGQRVCGVAQSGVLSGVYVRRMEGDPEACRTSCAPAVGAFYTLNALYTAEQLAIKTPRLPGWTQTGVR